MQPTCVLGFHCSHEQHLPSALLQVATLAAEAGFTAAMCSDHSHPWSERQGQSGFAWSRLGAALQATRMSYGTVCAPGQRYHPAVIAQAAATLSDIKNGSSKRAQSKSCLCSDRPVSRNPFGDATVVCLLERIAS